jgi:hypothetical protein
MCGTTAIHLLTRVQPHHKNKKSHFGVNPYPLSVKSDCHHTLHAARHYSSEGGGYANGTSRDLPRPPVFYRTYTVRLTIQYNAIQDTYHKSMANPAKRDWPIYRCLSHNLSDASRSYRHLTGATARLVERHVHGPCSAPIAIIDYPSDVLVCARIPPLVPQAPPTLRTPTSHSRYYIKP